MWKHKKFARTFFGTYVWKDGNRFFQIYGIANKKVKMFTFDSWNEAKDKGWEKV